MKTITIRASDGYNLSAMLGLTSNNHNKNIIISSATAIKKEYYINFATFLLQKGYNVLIFDYRGVGGSAPQNLKTSDAFINEWGILDMNAALDFMVNILGLTNIIWIGHSIGFQLVGFLENQKYIKKVVAICSGSGYWANFSYPTKINVWIQWFLVVPIVTKVFGYGTLKMVGWGENLPKNVILEWRDWCIDKDYCKMLIENKLQTDKFYDFNVPITSIYLSDDPITNDKSVSSILKLYPNSNSNLVKLNVKDFTNEKVGHIGIFRKKFANNLWPILLNYIGN